jgi:hypothetical protein
MHQCNKMLKYNIIIQFVIIYVPSQQLQGQLQTQHNVHVSNYIVEQTDKQTNKLNEVMIL